MNAKEARTITKEARDEFYISHDCQIVIDEIEKDIVYVASKRGQDIVQKYISVYLLAPLRKYFKDNGFRVFDSGINTGTLYRQAKKRWPFDVIVRITVDWKEK